MAVLSVDKQERYDAYNALPMVLQDLYYHWVISKWCGRAGKDQSVNSRNRDLRKMLWRCPQEHVEAFQDFLMGDASDLRFPQWMVEAYACKDIRGRGLYYRNWC